MTPIFSRLYGLYAQLNAPLPYLNRSLPDERVDVRLRIFLQALPPSLDTKSRQPWFRGESGLTGSLVGDGRFVGFSYQDGCEFFLERGGREIWCSYPERFSTSYISSYLLGPMMGCVLRFRNISCLHASAVSVGGRAIVLMGSAGAGKSTTAAAFACLGFPVLSDDIVPLYPAGHNHIQVEPGYPRICLWSSSVEALFGSPEALPLISEEWEKRQLDLQSPGYHFCSAGLPLGGIYILGDRQEGEFAVSFSDLSAQNAAIQLITHTYANRLPIPEMAGQDLKLFSNLVKHVPVRLVRYCGHVTQVRDLAKAIAADFTGLSERPRGGI